MDRSLWLLTRLRLVALFRRWRKSLARPKGILITVVFAILFAPSVVGIVGISIYGPKMIFPMDPSRFVERFGPAAFFLLLFASLFGTTREAALYYSPAEIDYLFPGPYRRRQLIAYKLILTVLASLFSAVIIGCTSRVIATWFLSAVVSAVLAVTFIQLTQMVLTLAANLVGAILWSRTLRVIVLVVVGLLSLAILPSRDAVMAADWKATGLAIEQSPISAVLLAPFRPFVYTLTARSWSGLAVWGGLGLAIDLVLVALILALDAGYLEAATVASGKRLALAKKMVGAGGTFRVATRRTGRFQIRPPEPAWWSGVGPNLWRQMIAAAGDPAKLVVILVTIGCVSWFFASVMPHKVDLATTLMPLGASMVAPLTLLLSMLLSFDFRGDLDVMETLKTLPIPPTRLALGQVLTPAILGTLVQVVACLGLILGLGQPDYSWVTFGVVIAFLFPANLYFFAVENLLFLWYPSRMVVGQFNGMVAVRQMLLLLAKMIALGVGVGVVGAVGGGVYVLTSRPVVALVLAWLVLAGMTIAILPLLGRAFDRFDVNVDIPS